MAWIQKNLMLVVGGLFGLVLLAGSALFLSSQYGREGTINTALEEKRGEWNRLIGLNPFPDEKNIKAVKDDTAEVEKLSAELRGRISPIAIPALPDTLSLKLLIETTISDLRKEAEGAGVSLPPNYAFTFQKLREMPQFESNAIPRLAEQVAEITILSRILFDAKVHTLDTFKRCPILKDEGNSPDYLGKKSVTNNWVVRSPYDFSFRAFSGELAEVLKGLAALEHCVVIKTINVEPTSLPQGNPSPGMMPFQMSPAMANPALSQGGGRPGGMDPALAARYGLTPGGAKGEASGAGGMSEAMKSRYGLTPGAEAMRSRYGGVAGGGGAMSGGAQAYSGQGVAQAPGMVPSAGSAPSVVLEEKPLRIIMQVDFVKPKPVAEVGRRAAAPRAAAAADPETEAAPEENATPAE